MTQIVALAALAAAPTPNFMFILADDLGYNEMGCAPRRRPSAAAPRLTPLGL